MNNLYFLLEGRQTEMIVYPEWLKFLLPHYSRVDSYDAVTNCNYYLLSAEGYPRILNLLRPALEEITTVDRYTHLVLCLDADDVTPEERILKIEQTVAEQNLKFGSCRLEFIIQTRCMETWFLGNPKMFPPKPQRRKLADFMTFYNVRTQDPERMDLHPEYVLHSAFHLHYLKEAFAERGQSYQKYRPGHVCDVKYIAELCQRVVDCPDHLLSLRKFLNFCQRIHEVTAAPTP